MLAENKKELIALLIILTFFLLAGFIFKLSIFFILGAIISFFGFYIYKSISFINSFKEKKLTILEGIKLFFICDFIELITFTGKIGADAAKLFFLKQKYSLKEITKSIIIFRISTIISLALILLILFFPQYSFILILVLALIFFIWRIGFIPLLGSIVSDFIRIFLFIILLFEFNIEFNLIIVLAFLGASTIARLFVFIPHGLFIQDSIIAASLISTVSITNNVLINSILRIFTTLPSAIIGGLILSKDAFFKVREFIKKQKEKKTKSKPL